MKRHTNYEYRNHNAMSYIITYNHSESFEWIEEQNSLATSENSKEQRYCHFANCKWKRRNGMMLIAFYISCSLLRMVMNDIRLVSSHFKQRITTYLYTLYIHKYENIKSFISSHFNLGLRQLVVRHFLTHA